MKNFEQFLNEADKPDPEDEMNNLLDKKGKKELTPDDKKRLIALNRKAKRNDAKKFRMLPLKPIPLEDIQKCDKVTYHNPSSEHNGEEGIVQRVRKDGKVTVKFEDGSRLAANPIYLRKVKITKAMKSIDPYNEEDW
jgi:hypothetical protein